MTFINLMNALNERAVRLQREGSDLIILSEKDTLTSAFLSELSAYKAELLNLVDRNNGDWRSPGFIITPEMVPLVELSAAEIEKIVNTAPGGAANIQDIYPLTALQEGILFHHQISTEGDPYLTQDLYGFDSRGRLEAFLQALQAVIDRHDILRTAVQWEGLREPVQVVWRQAPLIVEEISIGQGAGDVARRLEERFNPRSYRIDIRQAPMMRVYIAHDEPNKRWVMLCLYHHLSVDHTTMEILQEEILAHLQGRVDRLPAPLPFRNFVAQARMGVSREEHESFFREMLGDVDEPTAPYGLSNVHDDGSNLREVQQEVDALVASRLRERARALGVSVASLCHLAWARVLAQLSEKNDVVFGTVLLGRMQGGEGADRVLGMFINTLPIRIRIGEESVEESVSHTHRLLAELLRHEHAPLPLAQRCSAVVAPAPLFSSLINYRHNTAAEASDESSQAWEGIEILGGEERSNYPVNLDVSDWGKWLVLKSQARPPIDPDRICAYMGAALGQLAEALERSPATPVRNLNVLPAREREQLLVEWNDTGRAYGKALCIHEQFERQVKNRPEAIALIDKDRRLSYAELDARANRLAYALRRRGVGAETLVGICVKRSLEMVVGLIGVLKAGGAYVPLDPSYPAERRTAMIEDSSPRLLLTEKSLPPHLPAQTPELIMADVWQEFERVENEDLRQVSESENAAYVIYTSGSTGKPKGVVVSHRAVFNQLAWAENAYQLTADDRVIHKTSISFDPSILEIFLPLGVGAQVVITEPDGERDPEYLLNVIAQEQITYLDVAPSLLRAILSCPAVKSCSSLRLVVSGSETLDTDLAENFEKTLKAKLCNAYGPTETTVQSTFAVCRPRVERIEPIGRPIANTQVYVLDESMSPVPVGVAGELYIGGEGLARGYLNQGAITGDRFAPNPYSKKSGERMYRTGDRVKYDGEGNLVFLGRRDEQVKVRGYRVELGEIEAVLNERSGVRQSAVAPIEDGNGMRRLAGFVVGDGEASPAELKRYVRERLPDYMSPEAFVWLESLPLTPSGKVDRKALQLLKVESSRTGRKSRSAQTPFEEIVAGIIEEVLQLERVGREENFFEIGGHSLLATQVITRVRGAFGVEIGVRSLFEEPTVEGLSRKVEEVMTGVGQEAPPPAKAKREGRGGVRLPLSFAQERLWILDRFAPNKSFYNIPCAVRLEGKLDLELLERVINEVVRRHETLRTRIEAVEGAPVQVIGEWKRRKLKRVDLTNLAREEREEEARRIARKEARRGFDLNKGPLLRVKALKLGEEQHVLLYTMHHIVSDAGSVGKLMQEVGALYDTMSKGQVSPLPELKIQYADYASWQRQHMTGALLEKHLSYWKKQLGGKLPALDLPVDHPRRPGSSCLGGEKSFSLPAELSQSLRELSRRERVTLSMVLLATFKTLLYRYTSQDDIIVETEAPNRNRAEIEPLIGLFMNMLPLRTDLSGNPRFRELLRRVKEVALGGHIYQDIPFEKLVEEMRPDSAARGIPLPNIAFGMRSSRREDLMLNGLKIKPVAAEQEMVRFDMALWVTADAEGVQVCWTYNKNLFEERTVMRMHNHFETLLFNIADRPDARLLSLKISSRAETRTGHEEQEDLEGSNLRKLKSIKRKGVRLPTEPA